MGWAFTSGFGVDYQIRIYNPYVQGKRYDPECIFIKQWIPELKDIPNNIIHNWDDKYKEYIDEVDYPKPIIESDKAYDDAKKLYN